VHACAPQLREELYQLLGGLAAGVPGFYARAEAQPLWAAALAGDLDSLPDRHLRILGRHVLRPLIRSCPPPHRWRPSALTADIQCAPACSAARPRTGGA
jgi:hypothetical protein